MIRINVQRGTNAGTRPPMKDKPTERWQCYCEGIDNGEWTSRAWRPPYLVRCPDCHAERPS